MRPIQIIAECGINHNGIDKIARELIREAKNAGADVAKFQLYDPRKREDIETHKWKDVLLESRLTKRQLYFLKDECDRADIEFMCSVFDVERVGWLEEIGVKRYKIASKSAKDVELAKAVADTKKPVIVSGSSQVIRSTYITDDLTEEERNKLYDRVFELYCISNYPTSLNELEFVYKEPDWGDDIVESSDGEWTFLIPECSSIFGLHKLLGYKVGGMYYGFSDHTIGITASIMAMSLGAKIIEKHFTLDKTAPGPDHLLSVEPQELRMLCKHRDDIERILYG